MSHYKRTEAQTRFLTRMYAQQKDEERCCDCPGCDTCTGFVRNCECDMTKVERPAQKPIPDEPEF